MNRIIAAVVGTFVLYPICGLTEAPQTSRPIGSMSSREALHLMKNAHTAAEYKRLAGYFHQREAHYRVEAATEKIEWDRRAQVNASLYQKYPRPLDSAKELYFSFTCSADSAAQQAARFDKLAADQNP